MGVYIRLSIIPDAINIDAWERVYEESLELINAYLFLDRIVDTEIYGCNWVYTDRTKERPLEGYDGLLGWYTFGDCVTHNYAEAFSLLRDLDYYRKIQKRRCEHVNANDRGGDGDCYKSICNEILCSLYNWSGNDMNNRITTNVTDIFDSKTQGYPYHQYILAIACLIESRFPKYAAVHGDISKGQMQSAIDWANGILKKPIQITDRADNERLLKRIKDVINDEYYVLEAFMGLTVNPEDIEMGDFLRNNISKNALIQYNTRQLKRYRIGMLGFREDMDRYFGLGFGLAEACDICVLNEDGCRFSPVEFLNYILDLYYELLEKDQNDDIRLAKYATFDPESRNPDNMWALFNKTMLKLAGYQDATDFNVSFEVIEKIFYDKFSNICDVKQIIDQSQNRDNGKSASKQIRDSVAEICADDCNKYNISDLEDLIQYEINDTIDPILEKSIFNVNDFIEKLITDHKDSFDKAYNNPDRIRIAVIIKANRYFHICKETWDYIKNNISNRHVFDRVLGLLWIKADEINVHRLCKSLINNTGLFRRYIIKRI